MNSNDEPETIASESVDQHSGYDLESGVLARVREWIDVLPWLRLGRTLRIAASPPLLILVAITMTVWWIGYAIILGESVGLLHLMTNNFSVSLDHTALPSELTGTIGHYVQQVIPVSIFAPIYESDSVWRSFCAIIWSLIIWAPTTLLLIRQGALLTAGRNMTGLTTGFTLAAKRSPIAWLLALIPLACVAMTALMILMAGWLSRAHVWMESPAALLAALIAIPCGILAFGASVAVPLGWGAVANEQDPDALDSLSRGYEYLYRRPLQLTMYAFLALAILVVITFFASAVSIAATDVATSMLNLSGASEQVQLTTSRILELFPTVVALTLFWSLVGGIYLLLRRDAGGQEVEDIWQPPSPPSEPLPTLPGPS